MKHPHGHAKPQLVVAWEVTRRCALKCRHCRGAARDEDYAGELSTEECRRVIDGLAEFGQVMIILTGGEPMARADIFELARYATDKGLRVVMAPCGHLITPGKAREMKESGVMAISISLDGATAEAHDAFRGVPGAYERTLTGLEYAKAAGIPFQINTTVTRQNVDQLPLIMRKAEELGAKTFDLFFLVPTGRGASLKDLALSAEQQEDALQWVLEAEKNSPLNIRVTCASQFARIQRQQKTSDALPTSRGCLGGKGFVFISHTGVLQPCGFLDLVCGDLRAADFDFKSVYEESPQFQALRDVDGYHGKCGICEFRHVCGGCRARAFAQSGDWLGEEPGCGYIPRAGRGEKS